jgi:hypothetical protein
MVLLLAVQTDGAQGSLCVDGSSAMGRSGGGGGRQRQRQCSGE